MGIGRLLDRRGVERNDARGIFRSPDGGIFPVRVLRVAALRGVRQKSPGSAKKIGKKMAGQAPATSAAL